MSSKTVTQDTARNGQSAAWQEVILSGGEGASIEGLALEHLIDLTKTARSSGTTERGTA